MADKDTDKAKVQPEQEATEARADGTMHVKIYAPFQVYYEGEAASVSAENATGPFDILPKHHNFMCMLVPCIIRVATPKGVKEVPAHRALMHVKADKVVVFMDV